MKNIEEIQSHIDRIMKKQNDQGLPDFEGYSPIEMQSILYDTFGENSPIQIVRFAKSEYKRIPLLNQTKYLLKLIDKQGELKLTNKGFLPTKIVSEIYHQGFIKEEHIESGISKLYKETDSLTINLTRILVEISGLVKKRNNKLSLTKKSKSIINSDFDLLLLIFTTFGSKFNWAYYDGYGENSIGQIGFGFSLILLQKYGTAKRPDTFYSDKYFKAFPDSINEIEEHGFRETEETARRCYSVRTFDRFLDYFGLIKIESADSIFSDKYITKTDLFDRIIKSTPHNKKYSAFGR